MASGDIDPNDVRFYSGSSHTTGRKHRHYLNVPLEKTLSFAMITYISSQAQAYAPVKCSSSNPFSL
jgi:hypothetical protein